MEDADQVNGLTLMSCMKVVFVKLATNKQMEHTEIILAKMADLIVCSKRQWLLHLSIEKRFCNAKKS